MSLYTYRSTEVRLSAGDRIQEQMILNFRVSTEDDADEKQSLLYYDAQSKENITLGDSGDD